MVPAMSWLEWVQNTPFARWMAVSPSLWAYPTVLTAHTFGLGILVGANVVLSLRLLGFLPGTPMRAFRRLVPVMWTGFGINTVSGLCLFVADATTKASQTVFYVKLALVAAGVLLVEVSRRTVFVNIDRSSLNPGDVSSATRLLAAGSILCWAGAITAGRLMAYLK
jgi:hypothetical protein